MKNRTILTMLSLALTLPAFAAAEDGPPPPAEIKAFAGGQWSVESFVYGDLTGGKTKDAAILISINPEHAFGNAQDRKLVVALRGADGKLHKSAEGTNSIPLGAGPAGTDPEVSIARNSVFVSQFGGSREKGEDKYQYKNMNGTWRLIGMTSSWYDSLSEDIPTSNTDVNFLTNYVEASLERQSCKTQKVSFYEIPSIKGTPPAVANADWKAPYLVLKAKDPKDLSANVESMHDKQNLYIRCTAKDNSVLPEDKIDLFNESGKVIQPVKRARVATSDGYQETITYNIKKAPFADSVSDRMESSFLPLTLKIMDADKDAPAVKTLSTAVSARGTKPHGGLLVLPIPAAPTLQNINVREGSVHPLVFPV